MTLRPDFSRIDRYFLKALVQAIVGNILVSRMLHDSFVPGDVDLSRWEVLQKPFPHSILLSREVVLCMKLVASLHVSLTNS